MNRVRYRAQQTVAGPAEVRGVGFLTGADIRLRFLPAPPSSGVVFARTDLGPKALLPARLEMVTGTQRRTTLGAPPLTVGLVEHVLAALAGLHIDNCLVEVNAPEPPGLDGSAWGFVAALRRAGTRLQPARRAIWSPTASIIVRQQGATLALHPTPLPELRLSYILNYGMFSPIGPQRRTLTVTPESFANELASCRTFLLEEEAQVLKTRPWPTCWYSARAARCTTPSAGPTSRSVTKSSISSAIFLFWATILSAIWWPIAPDIPSISSWSGP